MRFLKRLCVITLSVLMIVGVFACKKPIPEQPEEPGAAVNSIAGVDALNRVIGAAGDELDRDVGLFYFLWLGAHGNKVYDVSELLENNPDDVLDPNSAISPKNAYHFWGEPLYGYYRSDDPWVLTRHVELFTAAGVDYLLFDVTNGPTYDNVVRALIKILDKYQKQGFDVPKIGFLTNAATRNVVQSVYNNYYTAGSEYYYPELWYSPLGKPMICSNTMFFDESKPADKVLIDFFDIRNTQWPNNIYQDEEGFPWMSWTYPQMNYNGTMSVSVAQHVGSKMSLTDSNWGRGYSQTDFKNKTERVNEGSNFQSQWSTVYKNNADKKDSVNNVFVTGWNEWIAIKKYEMDEVFFVDLYNEEYSRDLEMMKGGYGDNYYMQLVKNLQEFKYEPLTKKNPIKVTVSGIDDEKWNSITPYNDFNGDAMERDFAGYDPSTRYTDKSNRNDIVSVKVTGDSEKLYFLIENALDIPEKSALDKNWMNIWLRTNESKTGYNFVINREANKIHKIENNVYTDVGNAQVTVRGKQMFVSVNKSLINLKDNQVLNFKVSDNVDGSDPMNFYQYGDSAPIGRLDYTYGYSK